MKIEWATRARTDIRELRRYIAQDSPHYARRFVDKIFQAVEKLPEHPRLGRQVPEAARDDVRELIFRHYRIIYVIKPNCVFIASIIHGSRDLSRQTSKPWEVE